MLRTVLQVLQSVLQLLQVVQDQLLPAKVLQGPEVLFSPKMPLPKVLVPEMPLPEVPEVPQLLLLQGYRLPAALLPLDVPLLPQVYPSMCLLPQRICRRGRELPDPLQEWRCP